MRADSHHPKVLPPGAISRSQCPAARRRHRPGTDPSMSRSVCTAETIECLAAVGTNLYCGQQLWQKAPDHGIAGDHILVVVIVGRSRQRTNHLDGPAGPASRPPRCRQAGAGRVLKPAPFAHRGHRSPCPGRPGSNQPHLRASSWRSGFLVCGGDAGVADEVGHRRTVPKDVLPNSHGMLIVGMSSGRAISHHRASSGRCLLLRRRLFCKKPLSQLG